MEMLELTEYDRERKPQEITMDSEMAISPRSLFREIVCPICLDILSQTRAAPECLHRFCKNCIEKIVKKECPVCRKKLPPNVKTFKEDPKFDQLIAKIYNGYGSRSLELSRNIIAPDCEIILRNLNGQETRYLKCPNNTTVDHLCRYLAIRPESTKMPVFESDEVYKLCLCENRSQGAYEMLAGELKLDEIKRTKRLESDKPIELYFYNPPR